MFTKKAFILTIGNESALLSLNHGTVVKNKVLVPSLSREEKIQLLKIFKQNKRTPVYILLDNAEQTYTNKSYPSINRFDLKQIINRHIKQEFAVTADSEELIYNHITYNNRKMKRWECVYVSSTYFEEMDKWIDFLLQEVSNPIMGIYMLPIETISLVKKLRIAQAQDAKKKKKKNKKENKKKKESNNGEKITLLIIQNKVSGIRQVVFSDEKIIFTRLTNYNHEDKNFIVDFEQDIFRTNEYLKRILPNLRMEDIDIINILPRVILEKVKLIKNHEINFINYTPREAAEKIGYSKLIPKNSQFGDILISNVFVNSNKILKSITKKIRSLSLLDKLSKTFIAINALVIIVFFAYASFIQIEQSQNNKKIRKLEDSKIREASKLAKIKLQVIGNPASGEDGNLLGIEEIIEFGKLNEAVIGNKTDPIELYNNLQFFTEKDVSLNKFSYNNSYSTKNKRDQFTLEIGGKIINESGDVESLFQLYDDLILETTTKFKDYTVTSSELPKNLDFSKKYHNIAFILTIKSRN